MEYIIFVLLTAIVALAIGIVVMWYRYKTERFRTQAAKEQATRTEEEAHRRIAEMKEEEERRTAQVRDDCERRIEALKAEHREATERERGLWQERFEEQTRLAREQMRTQFEAEMKERSQALKAENREQMEHLMAPMDRELKRLQELMDKSSTQQTQYSALLRAGLQEVVRHDKERDKTTQDLVAALKNRGKVHGDWGEQVLDNILRDSGLREGFEYYKQVTVHDDSSGNNLRPDVVVHLSSGSSIVIDSKVSLTAYTDYVGAETEEERKAAIRANRDSIWSHVMELDKKEYQHKVKDAIPLSLMFVPNEGSYILAMNADPQLGTKAYNKGVLIVNPTNLMVVLRLIHISWNNTQQERNCQEILEATRKIYDKFCLFAEGFVTLGRQLDTARGTYDKSLSQLREGRGNLSDQLQNLMRLGITPNKELPEQLLPLEDAETTDI